MNSFLNLPNALTLLRLALAPYISYLILQGHPFPAFLFFIIALLTDQLDGFLARKYGWVTALGTHLDRWADKILLGCVLTAILLLHHYTFWLVIAGIATVMLIIGYFFAAAKAVQVTYLGRMALWLEAFILGIMIIGYVRPGLVAVFFLLLCLPAADYLRLMLARRSSVKR